MEIIQKPTLKISRPVTDKDVPGIMKLAEGISKLCNEKIGRWEAGAHALAHVQVDDKAPMRFYVLKTGVVIINPSIADHTRHTVSSMEGCLSYKYNDAIEVQRFRKIRMECQTIEQGEDGIWRLSVPAIIDLNGLEASIAQHEIDHMDGKNIYDNI